MKVDFLILGAQKGGSTWLFNALQNHHSVNAPRQEVHFFSNDDNYTKGIEWYHNQFPPGNGTAIAGEKTPEYLTVVPTLNKKTSTNTVDRIFSYNPQMKLIVVLREPIARLKSAINHMYRTRRIAPWTTAYDLIFGKERDAAEAFSLLQNGLYFENLTEYLRLFPREQIKIMFFESDVLKHPAASLADVCAFLKIPFDLAYFPSLNGKRNEYQMSLPAIVLNYFLPGLRPISNRLNHIFPAYKVQIDAKTRSFLEEFYASSNKNLATLAGPLPDSWTYR